VVSTERNLFDAIASQETFNVESMFIFVTRPHGSVMNK
jgi:hypothetical protein